MCPIKILQVLFIIANVCEARIYMSSCGVDGFSCNQNKDGTLDVSYFCGDSPFLDDVVEIWLYDFRAIPNIRHLTIDGCDTVRLQMKCSSAASKLESLLVTNVRSLVFLEDKLTQNPAKMVFENISNIDVIPKNTFTQLSKHFTRRGCANQAKELQIVKFRFVSIGVIESQSFYNLEDIVEISFIKTTVQRVEFDAFNVNVRIDGKFMILDSLFENVEEKAFNIIGRQILVSDDDFMELQSGGPNTLCLRVDELYRPYNNE